MIGRFIAHILSNKTGQALPERRGHEQAFRQSIAIQPAPGPVLLF